LGGEISFIQLEGRKEKKEKHEERVKNIKGAGNQHASSIEGLVQLKEGGSIILDWKKKRFTTRKKKREKGVQISSSWEKTMMITS